MPERAEMRFEALLRHPLAQRARAAWSRFMRLPWARWALAGAGVTVTLAVALSAIHAHSDPLAPSTPGAPATMRGWQGSASSSFGPLVSRGKHVSCSRDVYNAGGPDAITSGIYGDWSFWQAGVNKLPSWCAIHLGVGPQRLLVVWSSDYVFDYTAPDGMTPRDYALAVSGDSTDGSDGHWQTVATVTNNETRVREAAIPFTGMSWIKMTVTRGQSVPDQPFIRIDQIDCFDVSAGLNDTALFQGDSITALAYDRSYTKPPFFDELMHQRDPRLYPTMLNEGLGGWQSDAAVKHIKLWLALNPDIHYWLLGWGTNDAFNMVDPHTFHDNLQYVINAIKAAGHVPVLARIPALRPTDSQGAADNAEIQALNAQIDLLTRENHLIPGPDLYALTSQHLTTYLGADGIHPTPTGAVAMNEAWYLALRDAFSAGA